MLRRSQNHSLGEVAPLAQRAVGHLQSVSINHVVREKGNISSRVECPHLGVDDLVDSQQKGENILMWGEELRIPIVDAAESLMADMPKHT